jgi:hypothetical protein
MAQTMQRTDRVRVKAITPEQIQSILLNDGWHEVADCELTQFGIGEAASPPAPTKLYPSLQFRDGKTAKTVIVPLTQVLAFEGKGY